MILSRKSHFLPLCSCSWIILLSTCAAPPSPGSSAECTAFSGGGEEEEEKKSPIVFAAEVKKVFDLCLSRLFCLDYPDRWFVRAHARARGQRRAWRITDSAHVGKTSGGAGEKVGIADSKGILALSSCLRSEEGDFSAFLKVMEGKVSVSSPPISSPEGREKSPLPFLCVIRFDKSSISDWLDEFLIAPTTWRDWNPRGIAFWLPPLSVWPFSGLASNGSISKCGKQTD